MRIFTSRQFGFCAVMLVLALVALAAWTWDAANQVLRAQAWVSHTRDVISAVGDAEATLLRAEAGPRRDRRVDSDREPALAELGPQLDALKSLTQDNPMQQTRLAELRTALDRDDGSVVHRFQAMAEDEGRLLLSRQDDGRQRLIGLRNAGAALLSVLVLLLANVAWAFASDLAERRRVQSASADEGRRLDALARAMTLFNQTSGREDVLAGTLSLLANDPAFPVSAFYAHQELGGLLHLAARRGTPANTQTLVRVDEGMIGAAARAGRPIYLECFDTPGAMPISTGLADLPPAAMLFVPVLHQARLHGVLVLAAARRLSVGDRAFIDHLCAKLANALQNLSQFEGLTELASQLRVSADEINKQNEQLERASRMKSEFITNMSHELRTPLNAVIGFSQILRDGLAGEVNDEQREYLGDIFAGGTHLLALINDVLDLAKIESGQAALELAAVSLAELSASGMAMVRDQASRRRLQLDAPVTRGAERVWVDARKTKQIVFNLLGNALKFTPEGGRVSLALRRVDRQKVQAARSAEDVRLFAPGDNAHDHWLEIEVADSGIGIAREALQSLFQPFVQVDTNLARRYAGTGLGLTMVQRLVDLHGGGMMARSQSGQGSVFTVWLPWRQSAGSAPDVAAKTPLLDVMPAVSLVLVIEDNPVAAELTQMQLAAAGYPSVVEPDGTRGMARAIERLPTHIVLDIGLPDVSGWDLLAQLKDHQATRHIPVVIVSCTDHPQRGFALGAAQVLVKPVTQADLAAALAAALPHGGAGHGRVLVVDDDTRTLRLVCQHLSAAGYSAVGALGGQQGLEAVAQQQPDVIVLDLVLSKVSGAGVLKALAHDRDTAAIPIIVLSARALSAGQRELLHGRLHSVMDKADFEPVSIVAEVGRLLARKRQLETT